MKQSEQITGIIVPQNEITEADIHQMYHLMETFYDQTDLTIFEKDLAEKDWVLLLRKSEDQHIVGFTTMKLFMLTIEKQKYQGIFSGDTIVHRDYWGEQELAKKWIQFMLELEQELPNTLYWFLICKGYKTYRYLPVFYQEFYPRYDQPTPSFEKKLIDAFGTLKYGQEYNPETGVIHYQSQKDRLKEEIGLGASRREKDPHVRFFLQANPGHTQGEDLVCLTKIAKENLNRLGKRLLNL